MPIISQFYGIIIRIYFKDSEKHYLEHIFKIGGISNDTTTNRKGRGIRRL